MPFSFPSSPTVGQTSTQNGRSYRYAGNNVWELAVSGGGSGEDTLLRSLFVPPAPTNLTATAGNAQVALTWTAPTVLAQTPIEDYVVQFRLASASTWETFADGTSTATSATVTGLTNGSAYVFRVAAVNGVGTGLPVTSGSVTPAAGDPLWSSVSLLLHFEGSSVVDSSSHAHTVTAAASGSAYGFTAGSLSTAQSRFGSKSWFSNARQDEDGYGGGRLFIPSSQAFAFGTGDLVVEMWVYITNYLANSFFFSMADWNFYVDTGNGLSVGGPNFSAGAANKPPLNTWTHIALVRSSGQGAIYMGGSRVLSFPWTTNLPAGWAFVAAQGDDGYGNTNRAVRGYVDEVRVTKNSDRSYTGATITVPTAAFPDQ